MAVPKKPVTRNSRNQSVFWIGVEVSSFAQYHSIPTRTKIPLGAATSPTRPQKILKAVEVSNKEMVFVSERYKASISTPAISMITLASEKSVQLLGLTNQSEGIVIFSYIPFTNACPCQQCFLTCLEVRRGRREYTEGRLRRKAQPRCFPPRTSIMIA